jgi:hypothetical protein
MSNLKKPRKPSKQERVKQALHQRVQHERSHARAAAREKHLRSLMGLPTLRDREAAQ